MALEHIPTYFIDQCPEYQESLVNWYQVWEGRLHGDRTIEACKHFFQLTEL